MEVVISSQLRVVGGGLLLGVCLGMCYDWLRVLRNRWQRLTLLLDCLFSAVGLSLLLALTLSLSGGEWRWYLPVACLLGAVFYGRCLGGFLRPLWVFWLEAAEELFRLLILPLQKAGSLAKKVGKNGKKLFYFGKKCYIIRIQQRNSFWHLRRKESGTLKEKTAQKSGKKERKTKKNRSHRFLHFVLLLAILFTGLQIYRLQMQLQTVENDQALLGQQIARQQAVNEGIRQNLERAEDKEYLQNLARKELDFVTPGERVFYEVG